MWFLEHEGLFGGKRIWLRPGSQQLFGRTRPTDKDAQNEGRKVFIDNKNVSRKHMMIKVLAAPAETGTQLHSRSQVEITDLSCRQGTVIDGSRTLKSQKGTDGSIVYDRALLTATEHSIRLSNNYPPFTIKWQPIVITYASKEHNESRARSAQLHSLDIKTSIEFVFSKTTHVVSQKRNLPKVLSGLVTGIPIVTGEYLDAVLDAATHTVDASGIYVPSKLEEDFDTWWPKEKEYIPPAGAEPVARPDQMLEPDPSRSEVFSGLTFVFLTESQYNSLHEPISGGGGKALHYEVQPGQTTVDEYVEYVQAAADQKKQSRSTDSQLPVITVRLSTYPDGMEEWATNFVTGVEQALNQRSILQNEFLDAIISKDRSSLQKPPAEAFDIESNMALANGPQRFRREPTQTSHLQAPSQPREASLAPAQEPPKAIPRKRPVRRGLTTTSRFTGFDEYEPPTKVQKVEDTQMEDARKPVPAAESPPQSASGTKIHQTRRTRQSSIEESVEPSGQIDEFFPAAAAIKKRRAATHAASASVEPEVQPVAGKTRRRGAEVVEKMQKAKKKADREINVREEARKRIKEEEDRRKADEESLREALEGIDISEMKNLAKIAEMKIKQREGMPNQRSQAQSERWNPEWNGRKNFKKFRRRGTEREPQAQRVIVTLEQAPQKKGFGEPFFLKDYESPARNTEDERRLRRRLGRSRHDDSESEPGFTRGKPTKQPEVINVEDSGPADEEVIEERTSSQRNGGRTQRIAETQLSETQTQTQKGVKKRGPLTVAAGQPSSKRSRVIRRDDDSDEEETGFRFRRRD